MADVFELTSQDLASPRREVWREPLERLHAGHLVGAHGALASLGPITCGAIDGTHVSDLRVAFGVGGWGKP